MQQPFAARNQPDHAAHSPEPLQFKFAWPAVGPAGECDNFFLGIWHPYRPLAVQWPSGRAVHHVVRQGRNWLLAGAVSERHAPPRALVHARDDGSTAVAFRGYLCSPAVHSYSPAERLLGYWERNALAEHNGVFSAAVVSEHGAALSLVSDVLGFGPLYYRHLAGALLFATNPRFLVTGSDAPDMLAWRSMLEGGVIGADRSVTSQVNRLPAGKALVATGRQLKLTSWLELEDLPRGDRPLDESGIRETETVFQEAMDRCLALESLDVLLPLSSGHDSRRILASLVDRRTAFQAVTGRVFHKRRDLDARFAAEMARHFGFRHSIVETATPAEYVRQDKVRRLLADAESGMHSWVPGFVEGLPASPAMVFDGIAGDILGNPGYRLPALYDSTARDVEIILSATLPVGHDQTLNPAAWPQRERALEDLRTYLRSLPQRVNLAEFAFLLLRQRRSAALWSQQLLPAGYVPVCPFLDLEYVRLLLSFRPQDKHLIVLQRRCLAVFWPEYARFPGTRDIPPDASQRSARPDREAGFRCLQTMLSEIRSSGGDARLRYLLSSRGRMLLRGARVSRRVAAMAGWRLQGILELSARECARPGCWKNIS